MKLSFIHQNAEDLLYALLVAEGYKRTHEQQRDVTKIRYLHCKFFQIAQKPSLDDTEHFFDSVPSIGDCSLYFCSDGDLIIRWVDGPDYIHTKLMAAIFEKYESLITPYMKIDEFFVYYDWVESIDKLKLECFIKQKKITKHGQELAAHFTNKNLIITLFKTVQLTKMQRSFRKKPHILIVEDQIFSQKMLASILKDYTCHIAKNTGEALLCYMEKCPDIVFLDIELPDLSGHDFARLLNSIDDDSYVVMVSSNHYAEDIEKAKQNNVKGFIVKPYEKETILRMMEQFNKSYKRSAA